MSKKKVIILFHGYGSNGDDLTPVAKAIKAKVGSSFESFDFITPDAPFKSEIFPGGFQWFSMKESTDEYLFGEICVVENIVFKYIETVLLEKNIKYEDLILAGFSQGGALAIHTALRLKEKINSVISFSGGFINYNNILKTENTNKINTCLIHGKVDEILPMEYSIKAKRDLSSIGINSELHLIDKMNHTINDECIEIASNFIISNS